MTTNDPIAENDSGSTDLPGTGPATTEITSTFTTAVDGDEHTHFEPIAAGTHEYDHRRTTYVYGVDADGQLITQARYALHGDLKRIHETTQAVADPLAYAATHYDVNPSVSVGEEFEHAVGCSRPLHLRVRALGDRLRSLATRALGGA